MNAIMTPLIEALKRDIPMLVRAAPSSGDSLEGVLSRPDLQRCYTLLKEALGPPVKDFAQPVPSEATIRKAVEGLGGIRTEQCLFLKFSDPPQGGIYAALWPWASDPTRITLKIGLLAGKR